MGGCVCSNNIRSYFKGYSDCVLKSDNNKNVPEQNIKIIPKENIDNIDKMDNNENSKQNEKNEKNNEKMTKNNNSNTHDENQFLIDNNSNNNLYVQNIKNKEIENNKESINNSFSINNQMNNNKNDNNGFNNNNYNNNNNNNYNNNNNNYNNNNNNYNNNNFNNNNINNNNINNNNLNNNNINNNNIAMNNLLQGKAAWKKAETNYNYNLGVHNVIFINISRDSSIVKNDSEKEKIESTTPKMAVEKENIDEMAKGSKRIFSHFCKNKINEKSPKNQTTTNNHIIKHKHTINDYMNHYSDEMLNALNSIRKDPESFIAFIDDLIKNSQKTNEGIFINSQNVDDKYMVMEDYFLVFEQIKGALREIIKSNLPSTMEDFKYNDELEIMLDDTKDYIMNQSHIEKSSSISNYNDKNNSGVNNNNNHIIKRPKKNHKILDLSDDKIANLILEKRKEIKNKYPDHIFKMNIIKDIKINILMQISMEEYYNHEYEKKMLKDIIFNPQYKNFAVSWANELNRKFVSISCFA